MLWKRMNLIQHEHVIALRDILYTPVKCRVQLYTRVCAYIVAHQWHPAEDGSQLQALRISEGDAGFVAGAATTLLSCLCWDLHSLAQSRSQTIRRTVGVSCQKSYQFLLLTV